MEKVQILIEKHQTKQSQQEADSILKSEDFANLTETEIKESLMKISFTKEERKKN